MRIHANDPGAQDAIVRWQGVPIYSCIEVDTDAGWADCFVTDDSKKIVLDADGNPTIERIYGEFTVEQRA